MYRREFLKAGLGSIWAASGAAIPAFRDVSGMILTGSSRSLPAGWLALDGLLSPYNHWTQPAFLSTFSQTGVRTLRYPGGEISQFWDWSTGRIVSDPLLASFNPTDPYQNYAKACNPLEDLPSRQAQIIYTTNFAHGNLRLKNQGSSDPAADAAPGLESTIKALEFAKSRNIPSSHIELGNGFIQHGKNWIYSLGEFLFGHKEGGVPDYPEVAAGWARKIKAAFPEVKLAFCGGDLSVCEQDPFYANWNRAALQRLANESSVEALAIQLFIPLELSNKVQSDLEGSGSALDQQAQYQALHDPNSLRELFNAPRARLESLFGSQASGIPLRQTRFRVWVTGFNFTDAIGAVQHTWAHGLAIANFLDALLSDPQVDFAVMHNISGVRCGVFLDKNSFKMLRLDFPGLDLFRLQSSLPDPGLSAEGWVLAFSPRQWMQWIRLIPFIFQAIPPSLFGAGGLPAAALPLPALYWRT